MLSHDSSVYGTQYTYHHTGMHAYREAGARFMMQRREWDDDDDDSFC